MDSKDKAALAAIGTAAAAATSTTAATVTVATITTTAPLWGIPALGSMGLTTSVVTSVACPILGLFAAGGAVVWGGYKVYQVVTKNK